MREHKQYKYGGARALVQLHEKHLRSFTETWKVAKQVGVKLPATDDPYYKSLNMLLYHLLKSAGGYITWICEKLNLPDPEIKLPPDEEIIESEFPAYLEYLIGKWENRLCDVEPEAFEPAVYESRWGTPFCIDAMLEHAVMHPIRHEFQLLNLIEEKKRR